jgi:hypothetical protein
MVFFNVGPVLLQFNLVEDIVGLTSIAASAIISVMVCVRFLINKDDKKNCDH